MTAGIIRSRKPSESVGAPIGGPVRVSGPRRRRPRRRQQTLVGVVAIVLGVVIWEVLGLTKLVSPLYISTPLDVLRAGAQLQSDGELVPNALVTLEEWAVGFGLAVVVGVPVGMIMGWRLRVRQTFEPLLTAVYVTPGLALLPIVVLAVGIEKPAKMVLVFIEAVITIIVNAMAGVRETDPRLTRAARSYGAGNREIFAKVLFPSALPTIVAGLRLGAGRGVIAVIVAELYAGTAGLGQLISTYGQNFDTPPLLFLTLVVGVFGYLISAVLRRVESSLTSSWKA